MLPLLFLFAVVAGFTNPVQSGSNAEIIKLTGSPLVPAILIYIVAGLCILACAPFMGFPVKAAVGKAAQAPWWIIIAGVCNAFFMMASLLIAKKLGSATFTTVVVVTAVLTSVALDNYGLFGFDVRHASPLRIVGCALAAAGVLLIARF